MSGIDGDTGSTAVLDDRETLTPDGSDHYYGEPADNPGGMELGLELVEADAPQTMTNEIRVRVISETGPLKRVVLGLPDTYNDGENKPINEIMKKRKPIEPKDLIREFEGFCRILVQNGVDVHTPAPLSVEEHKVPDQLFTRDIGFVIGDTFFVSPMKYPQRKNEKLGIKHLLASFPRVVEVPEDLTIEGGDVIVENGTVYIGMGQRTSLEAIEFVKAQLAHTVFEFVVVETAWKEIHGGKEDSLHLDCCFMPVGNNGHALIYERGIKVLPQEIRDRFTLIPITKKQQSKLGTNVLNLGDNKVVVRNCCRTTRRIVKKLRKAGVNVIPCKFDLAPTLGGSFRCTTLPLERD